MAGLLRQKANEAYLDDDFDSAIAHFTQVSLVTPFAPLCIDLVWSPLSEMLPETTFNPQLPSSLGCLGSLERAKGRKRRSEAGPCRVSLQI